MTGLEELVANLEARIDELIKERDAAVEKLLEVQREMSWKCSVCDYPMKLVEPSMWECHHCREVGRLHAENEILRGRFGA